MTEHRTGHGNTPPDSAALNRLSLRATIHCLTGCSIGEVLGMVIGTTRGWSNGLTVVVSVALAFLFGYAFTLVPLVRAGIALARAVPIALAADTASIALMEVVDNGVMLLVPGAMAAPTTSALFWATLAGSLLLAGLVAFPLNRWLIARGRGHAVVHQHHH